MPNLKKIISHFDIKGTTATAEPLGNGLINDTYKVATAEPDAPDYVLQRINDKVFTNVDLLQANIDAVTLHIRRKLMQQGETDIDRKVLRFLTADTGKSYVRADDSSYWRMSVFIPRTRTLDIVDPHSSECAGEAFGRFESMLVDLPESLGETIPGFHDMELRISQLRQAVNSDAAHRLGEVKQMVEAIEAQASEMCKAEHLHREGLLPKRVCHCDTKVNNMLFDEDGKVLCVIDLDTVMPSYVFSDFGDFLRTAANTVAEDCPDIDDVDFKMDIFRAFAKGYLRSALSFLSPIEIENLPYAAALFPYMQCVRFLADYINGDTYYKTSYPEHNLVRAKNQWRLFEKVEARMPEMHSFISSCCQ